jgi:hypothetical protein
VSISLQAETLEIVARIGFPDVRGERAAGLVGLVIGVGEAEFEVVVPRWVSAECWVVLESGNVDWGTFETLIIRIERRQSERMDLPLFHRPTNRAPKKSAPSWGVNPSRPVPFLRRNELNSGTS